MEVMFDLDEEAAAEASSLGMSLVRAATVGTDPQFVGMLAELIVERMSPGPGHDRRAVGRFGPNHDVCPVDCCLPPARPGVK